MARSRLFGVAALLLLVSIPSLAEAYTLELKGIYWPATPTVTETGAPSGGWNTSAVGGDLRLFLPTHWGVHLQYATGTEGAWIGSFSTATSGTDTVYSGDLFYEWRLRGPTGVGSTLDLRTFAGYGQLQASTTFPAPTGQRTFTSNGVRVGADFVLPLPRTNLAVQGGVAWYPSNSTTLTVGGATQTSNAQAWDYTLSVQYTDPRGWLIEGGYRWITADTGPITLNSCPCSARVQGPFFALGFRW